MIVAAGHIHTRAIAVQVRSKGAKKDETGAEIGSDSGAVVPHDPANRHSNIKTKNSAGTWSLQTSTCAKINTLWNNVTHTSGTGLYLHWTITNYYDWQGRP
jgi:hypothetical protein